MRPSWAAGLLLAVVAASGAQEVKLVADDLRFDTDDGRVFRRIDTVEEWDKRRAKILAAMQEVMGPMPGEERRVPLDLRLEEEIDLPGYTRKLISFAVEADDRLFAYLLIPKGLNGPAPAMLCLHQTTAEGKAEPAGISGEPHLHYARELAKRGYITLAPDYPGFGGYANRAYDQGYASATMKGIWNHRRALDVLESMPEVDAARVGCIGHSLGGHNTLFLAAFDERIKVAVTSCGFTAFANYYGGDLTLWSHNGYMPRIAEVYGKDPARMPFDFPHVLAAIAPRAIFISAPLHDANFDVEGVRKCVERAAPIFKLLDAPTALAAVYPNAEHDFPDAEREAAYAFIDGVLGN